MYMTWPITNVFYRLIYISIQDPSWDGYLYHWHVITSRPFIGKKLPSTSYCQLSLYLNAQTNNYFHVMESSTVNFKINCFRYALKPGYESVVKGFSVYNVWRMMTEWTQMLIRLWLHYCPHKWPTIWVWLNVEQMVVFYRLFLHFSSEYLNIFAFFILIFDYTSDQMSDHIWPCGVHILNPHALFKS